MKNLLIDNWISTSLTLDELQTPAFCKVESVYTNITTEAPPQCPALLQPGQDRKIGESSGFLAFMEKEYPYPSCPPQPCPPPSCPPHPCLPSSGLPPTSRPPSYSQHYSPTHEGVTIQVKCPKLSSLSWCLKVYTIVLGGLGICVTTTWIAGHVYVLTHTQEAELRLQR